MSWVAHDLEPYLLQKHTRLRLAIVPLILGSYAPDMFTKPFVYGIPLFGYELRAPDPTQFHRGWPGVGFTHSLTFGVVLALLIYAVTRSGVWALSVMVGVWAHVLTDIGDSVGTMLFFPFTTWHASVGAWAYAAEHGRVVDGSAYFSCIGGVVWEAFWIALCLVNWRILTRPYFYGSVLDVDPVLGRLRRRVPDELLLILYRTTFFWGVTRWTAWMLYAHVVHHYPIDISWGGPGWVQGDVPADFGR